MGDKQRTLKKAVSISGVGLHTGINTTLTFKPAPENHGYRFVRTDLENSPVIKADVDKVSDTSRGTTLEQDGVKVHTTEHALAALYGLGIDNAVIEIDGPEIPILDGSAAPYVELLEKSGTEEQNAEKDYFVLKGNLTYEDDDRQTEMLAVPQDEFRITVMVDYNSPLLGTQHASMYHLGEFKESISGCRTFCFLREVEELAKNNLIKGGDLDNAIVLVDQEVSQKKLDELAEMLDKPKMEVQGIGVLNNVDLKFQNEPARHKLLDIVGDIALVGRPIKGHILAARPGHKGNVDFAKKIKEEIKMQEKNGMPPVDLTETKYDINQISDMLPHRYPFLMIDRIIEVSEEDIIGLKNVTMNEPFFTGHFPGNPVMPGVLQIEAMAQVGGIFALHNVDEPEKYSTYFLKIDNVRFKQKVMPGDTLIFHLKLITPIRRGIVHMKGKAFVNGKQVTQAEMMAQVVKER